MKLPLGGSSAGLIAGVVVAVIVVLVIAVVSGLVVAKRKGYIGGDANIR